MMPVLVAYTGCTVQLTEMEMSSNNLESRRQFLRFLAASPLAVLPAEFARAFPDRAMPTSLDEVLNIYQLDRVAQKTLPPDAYHFIASASDDGATNQANIDAYAKRSLRPRRLADVSAVDTTTELFGRKYRSPIVLAPVGDQQRIHVDGELATAQAAAREQSLMICSMLTNRGIGEITAVKGDYWFQLYPSASRDFMRKLLGDAAAAGCTAIVLTIDGPTRGNHEAEQWFRITRDRSLPVPRTRLGNFEGFKGPKSIGDPAFTWNDLGWLKENTTLPVLLKGIATHEDAKLCRKYGVDGVIVSNHGGRQEGNGRGTLDVLPEIVGELKGVIPVLIDGGIRRGSHAFTALALGADAVCIGRPYLWGLGAFGRPGVEKALAILQAELVRTMSYAGTRSLAAINRDYVWTND
jgi:isopentenyl diphosphate isomerase/L-lactate dehydrogenase-like FMN-dependent dehydrogenase